MKKLAIFLFLSASFLAACASKTEEEQIAAINKRIAPDGHLTKTHLYIHWPAVYTKPRRNDPGGKEIVPPVTLKIPMEYLGQDLISFENAAKIDLHDAGKVEPESSATDYISRIKQALLIQNHQITSIYLRLIPGAKPYVPMLPFKSDSPELAQKKAEHFLTSYAVHIDRNNYYANPMSERTPTLSKDDTTFEKPPRLTCSPRDYVGRIHCTVYFGVEGRSVQIGGDGEALDHPNLAQFNQSNRISPKTEPNGLPKWHIKVDPTQTLLKTFILSEDSPDITDMFPKK